LDPGLRYLVTQLHTEGAQSLYRCQVSLQLLALSCKYTVRNWFSSRKLHFLFVFNIFHYIFIYAFFSFHVQNPWTVYSLQYTVLYLSLYQPDQAYMYLFEYLTDEL